MYIMLCAILMYAIERMRIRYIVDAIKRIEGSIEGCVERRMWHTGNIRQSYRIMYMGDLDAPYGTLTASSGVSSMGEYVYNADTREILVEDIYTNF